MNCKICNFKNNFDANFCGNCGAIMQTNNENNTQQSQSTPQISVYTPTQSAWIFAKAIGFIIALQFAIAIFVIVFSIGTDTNILESMLVNLVIMILIQVMFFVAVLSSGTSKFRLIKQRLYISPKLLLIAISMWIIAFISFLSTNVYFGIFLESIGYTSTALVFSTPLEFFLGLLVICFIAPITEELVFRFGILEGFKNKGGVKAVLISSFAFAMMHMNPEQTFYQFLLGVVCGIATFKSNSIIPAIIIHACNNLFSFLITDWVWFNEILVYLFSQGWFVVVAIFLFISGAFSIIQISKLAKKYGNHNSELPLQISTIPSIHGNSVASLVYSLTIAICILFWVSAFVLAMS